MLWGLLGLLGFAALAWFCVARHVPVLEHRLQTSVLGALEPLNVGNVNVEMNGYAANISGAVQNSTVRDNIIAAAGSVAGVRTVNDNLQLIASPVTATVDSNDNSDQNLVIPGAADNETPTDAQEAPASAEQPQTAPIEAPDSPPPAKISDSIAATAAPESETDPIVQPEDTKENTGADGEPAELNISVAERTLTLTGRVHDQRELRPVVETVMTTFDLNYVSNKTRAVDSIAPIEWMDGLVTSVPKLAGIENPTIDVFGKQITLGGMVDSETDRQSIAESVQKNLSELNVVNRLRAESSNPKESTGANTDVTVESAPADATSDASAQSTNEEPAAVTEIAIQTSDEEPAAEITDTETATEETTYDAEAVEAARQAAMEKEFRAAVQQREEEEAKVAAKAAAIAAKEAEEAAKTASEAADKAAIVEATETPAEDPVATASQNLSTAFNALPNTQILFQSGSDVFTSDSEERLDQIAELLSEYPTVRVAIKGHTDSQGDEANNLALSQLRANAVRDYLVSKGISVFRLSSFGYGEGLPIAPNDTPDGRAANRRIEFSF